MFRLPAEHLPGAARVGIEGDGIAGSAGAISDGDGLAGHFFRRCDDLLHAEAPAGAEVAEDLLVLVKPGHGGDVGLRVIVQEAQELDLGLVPRLDGRGAPYLLLLLVTRTRKADA